jgi:quercetin dioxygenase-like cupin family protein
MTTARDTNLQVFIDHVRHTVMAHAPEAAQRAASRVFERLDADVGTAVALTPNRLPVNRHIEAAYSSMEAGPSPLPEIASALMALEPHLDWQRRRSARPEDGAFWDNHANAMLVGPGGVEQREDVWIGVTLMAPESRYVDHDHPPEEVYMAFTDGEWWNAAMPWTRPGPGGFIYNPPGIRHAMRSGATPMLSVWLLPVD